MKLQDTCETARAIIAGELDTDLEFIIQAAQWRKKNMFRKGMKFRLVGTKNPQIDGQIATVLKVNSVRISVGVGEMETREAGTAWEYKTWSGGEYNVPPRMLEAIA